MMTVRFPDGTSVQYNSASWVQFGNHYHVLRETKDGVLVALVPSTAIVELKIACRTYNSVRSTELEDLAKEVRALKRSLVKLLKEKK